MARLPTLKHPPISNAEHSEEQACSHCNGPLDGEMTVRIATRGREGREWWTFCGFEHYLLWRAARPSSGYYAEITYEALERKETASPVIVGARLRELRTARGWTQAEAAEKCGVLQPVWSKWERGKQIPRTESRS